MSKVWYLFFKAMRLTTVVIKTKVIFGLSFSEAKNLAGLCLLTRSGWAFLQHANNASVNYKNTYMIHGSRKTYERRHLFDFFRVGSANDLLCHSEPKQITTSPSGSSGQTPSIRCSDDIFHGWLESTMSSFIIQNVVSISFSGFLYSAGIY